MYFAYHSWKELAAHTKKTSVWEESDIWVTFVFLIRYENIKHLLLPNGSFFLLLSLWTEHVFLWSFRPLPAWLSTVTSCGVCRLSHTDEGCKVPPNSWLCWGAMLAGCCTTLVVNTKGVHKEEVCEMLLLPPAESTSFACCYPLPLHTATFCWRRGFWTLSTFALQATLCLCQNCEWDTSG